MKYFSAILLLPALIALNGCASTDSSSSSSSWAVPVKVISKNAFRTLDGALKNGVSNSRYIVADSKGRSSVVISPTDTFRVNQCVTLWRSASQGSNNSTYPRISAAQENCAPLPREPANIGKYIYLLGVQAENSFQFHTLSLDTWLDSSDSSLISQWGAPDSSYTTQDGKTFLTFSKRWVADNGYNVFSHQCDTTFEVHQGFVSGYSWKGDCY